MPPKDDRLTKSTELLVRPNLFPPPHPILLTAHSSVPPAFVNIQWKVYIVFGVFCVTMFLHVFFLFPETSGKSLEEVEAMFIKKIPAWKTRVEYRHVKALEQNRADEKAADIESSPERHAQVEQADVKQ